MSHPQPEPSGPTPLQAEERAEALSEVGEHARPSALGHSLTSLIANTVRFAKANGLTLEEISNATHLEGAALMDPETRLSDEFPPRIWQMIEERVGSGPLALHMARATPTSIFGPWIYPARFAQDLRTALQSLVRYQRILADRVQLSFAEDGSEARVSGTHPNDALDGGLTNELCIAMTHRILHEELGCGAAIKRIDLKREDGGYSDAYLEFFGVEVRHAQPIGAIVFHASALGAPPRESDPTLFAYANEHLLQLEQRWRLQSPADPMAQVLRAVDQCVAEGRIQVLDVARSLHMGVRSLQRVARMHGVTLSQLIDEARAARARGLLLDQAYDTKEIAHMLGYSDERAFRRAFRRWTGISPQEYRRA